MRKLMEAVAPLFESYAFKDQVYDRYENLSMHADNPEVKAFMQKADQCWKDGDLKGCDDALSAGEKLVAPKREERELSEAKADPEIVAKFADIADSQRSYYIYHWAKEKGIDSDDAMEMAGYERGDYMGAGAYMWNYVGESVSEQAETVTEESKVELINELRDILDHLDELGEQAHNIVRMIDRGEAERLDAYGAFDFGSSSNRYDTTLASFLEDLESGQYDERD